MPQRYFADADRVLILLHNDPDPDALASGLALRNLLRRTKATAIIGAVQGVTREDCRQEWLHVLHYPHLPLDEAKRLAAAAEFEAEGVMGWVEADGEGRTLVTHGGGEDGNV